MCRVDAQRLAEIVEKYDLDLIVLFGSQAKGRAVPGSDVDVAVRFVKRDWSDLERELDLISELAGAIKGDGDVDVAFLNGASPLLLFQVACTGKLLFERRAGDFAVFKSYAARCYYDSTKFFKRQEAYLREHYGSRA